MRFIDKLKVAQLKMNSWLCVGLDPDLTKIPEFLVNRYANSSISLLTEFNEAIINATAEFACCYKPNIAFYENIGENGIIALKKTIQFIRENHPDHVVILDAKRGDIGNTAKQYATAVKALGADAVTVNPYLGPKTLEPFLEQGLGIIALCVTSNPDAAIFQNRDVIIPDGVGDHPDRKIPFYQYVAEILTGQHRSDGENAELWVGNLGLVTGATHPEELGQIRELIGPDIMLLIPGIGKQAGDLEKTIRNNNNGLAVINSSSGIIFASQKEDYAEAAGEAAKKLQDEINEIRENMKG